MAPRTVYANLQDGLQLLSLWDQSLADMGSLGSIPCTASGSNALILTPNPAANAPSPTLTANNVFFFIAAASSTGTVTAKVDGLPVKNVYKGDGVTQAGSGDIISGRPYYLIYSALLNGGSGGFYLAPATGSAALSDITGLGTGVSAALATSVGSAGAFVTFNGAGGTPLSITLTNATGLPVSTGISGLGTGVATALGVAVGSAGAFVANGGALGTPSSGTLTNATGLPLSTGISGAGTGVLGALAVNVGTAGAVVVNGGALGTPSSGTLTSATGLPISTGVSGLGAGVATALGNATNALGGLVGFSGALGTPTSGVATNLTGTATGLTAGNVTTNANLTGPITSVGNATSIASQTGTGTKFVVDTSPTLVTPNIGVATATSVNKITITVPATGSTLTIADGAILQTSGAFSTTLTSTGATNSILPSGTHTLATIDGTTTNDNAAAGNVGEYVQSTKTYLTRLTLATGTGLTVTSISLTAGDWDVAATGYIETTGTPTGNTYNQISISQTNNTLDATEGAYIYMPSISTATDIANAVGPMRKSLAVTTTIYLVAQSAFTAGTFTVWGQIRARRVR